MPVCNTSLPNFHLSHIDLSHSIGWSGSPTVFPPSSIYRRSTPYKQDIKPWYVPRDSVIICLIFILSASSSVSAGKQTDVMSAVAALLDSSPTQPRISSSGGTLPVASSPIGRPLPPSGNTPLFPLRDARWTSDTSHEQSVLAQQSERQRLEEDLPPSSPESDDSSDEDSEDEDSNEEPGEVSGRQDTKGKGVDRGEHGVIGDEGGYEGDTDRGSNQSSEYDDEYACEYLDSVVFRRLILT